MDRIELKKRLSADIPVIDKRMLRGGMDNRNLRKEITRLSSCQINKTKDVYINDLSKKSESKIKKMRGIGWI